MTTTSIASRARRWALPVLVLALGTAALAHLILGTQGWWVVADVAVVTASLVVFRRSLDRLEGGWDLPEDEEFEPPPAGYPPPRTI